MPRIASPLRLRFVRPRRALAPAVRRADFAHRGVVGIVISFTLGLLLGGVAGYFGGVVGHGHHARHGAAPQHPVALSDHRARGRCFRWTCPAVRSTSASSRFWRLSAGPGLRASFAAWCSRCARSDFVTAAEALGFSRLRVIARHVLPNTMSYVIVAATLSIPGYILGEVVLSFLGVGVQEPSASWGNMLNQARSIRALTSVPVAAARARHRDLPDGDGVQLSRRRPPGRARSAPGDRRQA